MSGREEKNKLDIVSLINSNPLMKFQGDYESVLIEKFKTEFNDDEQKLFIVNFYCYNNYDSKDFIIDFNNVWKWLGFSRVDNCKTVLLKHFKKDIDYMATKLAPETSGASSYGGQNKEHIYLNIDCFKKLCLKSGTQKADVIHDYYIKMEKIINGIVLEQSHKLKEQLHIKDQEILTIKEKTMLDDFDKKRVIYLGFSEENVIKFGFSDDIKTRVCTHKREIGPQFVIQHIIETTFNRELELIIKQKLRENIITKKYDGRDKPQTELIQLDKNLTLTKLHKQILEMLEEFNSKDALVKAYEEIERLKEKYEKPIRESKPEKPIINHEVVELKKKVAQLKGEKQFIARNIITGEIKSFNSYDAARDITKIGSHSLRDNYLNQQRQCRGWVFHDHDKPCWYPPENFIFNVNTKPSSHMLMCKSVNKKTGSETYYNSIVECAEYISKLGVDFEDTETNRRTINRLVQTNKPTIHPYLSKFNWYIVENCGKTE